MLGYISFYFKIIMFDNTTAYAMYSSDFGVDEFPAKKSVEMLSNAIKTTYEEAGNHVVSIELCSKEEYETKSMPTKIVDIKW